MRKSLKEWKMMAKGKENGIKGEENDRELKDIKSLKD